MIDINELRQLAQAATPGPWVSQGRYIGTPRHMSYIGEVRDQCGNWSDTEKSRADAAFIAAANPAAITELLDRLEAVEKSDAESLAMYRRARDERDTLHAENEALAANLRGKHSTAGATYTHLIAERDALRAEVQTWQEQAKAYWSKIEAMEKQEPVGHVYRYGKDSHGRQWHGIYWYDPNLDVPTDTKLYALPGAQPAPSVPSEEAAAEMGANGGHVVEAERLAFEAWMRGHCWKLGAKWTGTEYRSAFEKGGMVDMHAMRTRELWAAWRDRAAMLAAAPEAKP